jgi:hypothetical protein
MCPKGKISACGPILPTCAVQQVGSYLGYSGHDAKVVATAAHDPKRTLVTHRGRQGGLTAYWGRRLATIAAAVPPLFVNLCPADSGNGR